MEYLQAKQVCDKSRDIANSILCLPISSSIKTTEVNKIMRLTNGKSKLGSYLVEFVESGVIESQVAIRRTPFDINLIDGYLYNYLGRV